MKFWDAYHKIKSEIGGPRSSLMQALREHWDVVPAACRGDKQALKIIDEAVHGKTVDAIVEKVSPIKPEHAAAALIFLLEVGSKDGARRALEAAIRKVESLR